MTMTPLELAGFYALASLLFLLCLGLTLSKCFRTGVFGTLGLGVTALAILTLLLDAWEGADYQLLRQTGLLVTGFVFFLVQTVWRAFKHNRLSKLEEAHVLNFPTRARGFAYFGIIAPLAFVATMLGLMAWWYGQGFVAGESKERAARDEQQLADRAAHETELAQLRDELATRIRRLSDSHAKVLDHLRKDTDEALSQKDRVIAELRAGSGSLQFSVAPPCGQPGWTCVAAVSPAPVPTPGPAGAPPGGLSGEPAVFLYQLADRADQYTRERNAAVDLLDAYERACGGQPGE